MDSERGLAVGFDAVVVGSVFSFGEAKLMPRLLADGCSVRKEKVWVGAVPLLVLLV